MQTNEKDLFESLSDYLQNVINTMPFIVSAYRNVDKPKMNEYTVPLIDGMKWMNEAISVTSNKTNINIADTVDLYCEFLESIESEDTTLTADLLEFEFLPKFKEYKKTIDNLL